MATIFNMDCSTEALFAVLFVKSTRLATAGVLGCLLLTPPLQIFVKQRHNYPWLNMSEHEDRSAAALEYRA